MLKSKHDIKQASGMSVRISRHILVIVDVPKKSGKTISAIAPSNCCVEQVSLQYSEMSYSGFSRV